jgi:hypothetical protein
MSDKKTGMPSIGKIFFCSVIGTLVLFVAVAEGAGALIEFQDHEYQDALVDFAVTGLLMVILIVIANWSVKP